MNVTWKERADKKSLFFVINCGQFRLFHVFHILGDMNFYVYADMTFCVCLRGTVCDDCGNQLTT
jgi:hypothetical protein